MGSQPAACRGFAHSWAVTDVTGQANHNRGWFCEAVLFFFFFFSFVSQMIPSNSSLVTQEPNPETFIFLSSTCHPCHQSFFFFFFSYRRPRKGFVTHGPSESAVSRQRSRVPGCRFCASASVNSIRQALVRAHMHARTGVTRTKRSLSCSHIVCSLIVFICPASHSRLIGNTSPDGSLSTWWD